MTARVYTLPAATDFLDALARGILAQATAENIPLPRFTVLLPNRRSHHALADAFYTAQNGAASLLPTMLSLGDGDEEELILRGFGNDIPQALSAEARLSLLSRLITEHLRHPGQPQQRLSFLQSWGLATELARLLDQIAVDELPIGDLCQLAPEIYADHWHDITAFLRLLANIWPATLAELGVVEPITRQRLLLDGLYEYWHAQPPQDPVIIAGSTASIPATARLMAQVAQLSKGAVILPGLDRGMDDASWAAIDCQHPQYYLRNFCARMGIERQNVKIWPWHDTPTDSVRTELWREIMRPASTTNQWQSIRPNPDIGQHLSVIEAPSEQSLAASIAIAARDALSNPMHRVAIVTPDRVLAQHVIAQLARFAITADDSAGQPLSGTTPGGLIFALCHLVENVADAGTILNLLAQPLCYAQTNRAAVQDFAVAFELWCRQRDTPLPANITTEFALFAATPAGQAIQDLVAGLTKLPATISVRQWWKWLCENAISLSTDADGVCQLEQQPGYSAWHKLCSAWLEAGDQLPPQSPAVWAEWTKNLLPLCVWRPPQPLHPRLQILSPIEARLYHADWVFLAGLDEGVWPPKADNDPWLSRPMRADYGLEPRERRIGQSAHDLVQLAATCDQVVLCRSVRRFGEQPLASRFWLRAETVLRQCGAWDESKKRGARFVALALMGDAPQTVPALPQPLPTPPLVARPSQVYVTAIELWQRDPYAFYTKHILQLRPLGLLQKKWDPATRGVVVHRIAELFLEVPGDKSDRAANLALLQNLADDVLKPWQSDSFVHQFWQPRLQQILRFLADTEAERHRSTTRHETERRIKTTLPWQPNPCVLAAKPDRLDYDGLGRITIVDYKTGTPPSANEIAKFLAPQLPLTAWVLLANGVSSVEALEYWHLHGQEDGAAIIRIDGDPVALAQEYAAGLERLWAQYQNPAQPYPSMPWGEEWVNYDDTVHFARRAEWSSTGGDA